MKLASLKHGRDGRLVVVSRDLSRCVAVPTLAPTLQTALDDWASVAPRLEAVATALESGAVTEKGAEIRTFDPAACAAPLPRAYQWADGSAYVNHVALVRRARGAALPDSFWTDPLMYQGGSDAFLGPCDDITLANDQDWGIDFEAEIAVITDDVPMGVSEDEAAGRIRLLTLVNDVSLRGLIPGELAKGFGFFQSKPSSAFAPVVVTPDTLGDAWDGARLHRPLLSFVNGVPFGRPDAGQDMTFGFPRLIAHAARTRPLGAGSIIGSGTVSNTQGTDHGSAIAEGGLGYSCIAEVRMIETIRDGQPSTPFLRFGDRVRITMEDSAGRPVFGAIDQAVARHDRT